jgi:hypothetical protein
MATLNHPSKLFDPMMRAGVAIKGHDPIIDRVQRTSHAHH